eukprot:scaffold305057_cov15-Tisochrysis_lutea.AAC.1
MRVHYTPVREQQLWLKASGRGRDRGWGTESSDVEMEEGDEQRPKASVSDANTQFLHLNQKFAN